MWTTPTTITDKLISISRQLDCGWVGAVPVKSESAFEINNCHNNVKIQTAVYGGSAVVGWYFLEGFDTIQAIRHTVWEHNGLIDVTPYVDGRQYIMFGRSNQQVNDYSISNCYSHSLAKYLMQETEIMYYIYQIVDPRNNKPFYIGKGTGRRAKTHLWEIPETRNVYKENKIAAIRKAGFEPVIEYIAENIIDEQLAYDIEKILIAKYGRKGYDDGGILTNVCPDNLPPNHKGKTYEDIYGKERAAEQRVIRAQIQKLRGGYGPKIHSEATRMKLKQASAGINNAMWGRTQSAETRKLIGEKAKLRVGKNNKKSKHYMLVSPTNIVYDLVGGELADFCAVNNLSLSTLQKQIRAVSPASPPKYGKTAGWLLRIINKGVVNA